MPAPVLLTAAQAGGAAANDYESVLAEVQNVSVTDIAPTPGPGDSAPNNQFEVDSALRVDDVMFLISPFPSLGSNFPSIRGILAFRNGSQVLLPRDASDVALGDPVLVDLAPALSFVNVGDSGVATGPDTVEVVLSHAVTADTFVAVTSSDDTSLTVVGGGVTVTAGTQRATVLVNGLQQAASVTLTASLDGNDQTAEVRVVGVAEIAEVVALSPPTATGSPNGTITLTVSLDIPAGTGGEIVVLSVSPGTSASVPATVTVLEGETIATFDVTLGADAGSETVTATLGASSATADIEIIAGGLVINEVDYDQAGTDDAEFVEIYNGSSANISLAGLSLVFINGSNGTQYSSVDLGVAGTLAAGQYLVVGSNSVLGNVPGTELTIAFSEATNNGSPDAVGLYNSGTDELLDALSYEGSITAGTITGSATGTFNFVEGTATTVEDSNVDAGSLSRSPNGIDSDDASADWAFVAATPGAANN